MQALKVKDEKCEVGLMKNYCITVSIQKISSIHAFIQQILGSHELTMPIFDQAHPKIIEIAFSFLKFAPAFQKSNHSITKQFWVRFQKIIHFKIIKFHHNLTHFSSQLLRKRSYQLLMKWKPTDQQFPKACQCKY